MGEGGHLAGGQGGEQAFDPGERDGADFAALDVINGAAGGIEADAALAEAAIRRAVEVNVGFEDALSVAGELAFLAVLQIANVEVGMAGPVADEDQVAVVVGEARRGEVEELVVAGVGRVHDGRTDGAGKVDGHGAGAEARGEGQLAQAEEFTAGDFAGGDAQGVFAGSEGDGAECIREVVTLSDGAGEVAATEAHEVGAACTGLGGSEFLAGGALDQFG